MCLRDCGALSLSPLRRALTGTYTDYLDQRTFARRVRLGVEPSSIHSRWRSETWDGSADRFLEVTNKRLLTAVWVTCITHTRDHCCGRFSNGISHLQLRSGSAALRHTPRRKSVHVRMPSFLYAHTGVQQQLQGTQYRRYSVPSLRSFSSCLHFSNSCRSSSQLDSLSQITAPRLRCGLCIVYPPTESGSQPGLK